MKQFDDLNDMAEGVLAVPAPENADRDEINTKTARSISMTHQHLTEEEVQKIREAVNAGYYPKFDKINKLLQDRKALQEANERLKESYWKLEDDWANMARKKQEVEDANTYLSQQLKEAKEGLSDLIDIAKKVNEQSVCMKLVFEERIEKAQQTLLNINLPHRKG